MADLVRLQRRAFLSRYGKGAAAVAVLGPSVLTSCSSDGTLTSSASNETTPTTSGSVAASTSANPDRDPGNADPDQASENDANNSQFRWGRVNMGFVSAYLVARGNKVTIVDSGVAENLPIFDEALSALGVAWSDVGQIILTHNHGDHAGGVPDILDVAPQAVVYVGEADLGGLRGIDARPLNDGDEVADLQIIGTPGHTAGHVSVFDPAAGFLVAGDALNEDAGLVLGPNPEFTADMTQGNASVLRLAERMFETVVFGHGNPIESGGSDAVLALAQTLG